MHINTHQKSTICGVAAVQEFIVYDSFEFDDHKVLLSVKMRN